jgi:hypothetical protein
MASGVGVRQQRRNRPAHVTAELAAGGSQARWPFSGRGPLAVLVFDPQRALILLIWVSEDSLRNARSNGGRKGDDLGGGGCAI